MTSVKNTDTPLTPDYSLPPGETISDLLDEQGMTQTDLARRLGISAKHLNQIIKQGHPLSAEISIGLERVFGVPTRFWLSRDANHRAFLAKQEETLKLEESIEWASLFPVADLKKLGFLPKGAKGTGLVEELLKFLGIATPDQWTCPEVSYRRSSAVKSNAHALSAWLRAGEHLAKEVDCEPFDARSFENVLTEIRDLTRSPVSEWMEPLVEKCAAAGVAVVVVPHFEGAPVNGATRWLRRDRALIQLSIRYRWEDIFWFTFFHEAGHVLKHRKKDFFLELPPTKKDQDSGVTPELRVLESEADEFASEVLIPPEHEYEMYGLSLSDVPAFAEKIGVSPAIVIGRLQYDGVLSYKVGHRYRKRLTVTFTPE